MFQLSLKSIALYIGLSCVAVLSAAARQRNVLAYVAIPAHVGNHRNSEATILDLGPHRLLLAWTEFYTSNGGDWGPARISAMTSRDGGLTWSDKHVLQRNIGKMNVMEANLLRLHDGRIFFVFGRKNSPADSVPMFRISLDNRLTFSSPQAIPVDPHPAYYTINNDRVIQLGSGRILAPLAYTKDYRLDHHFLTRVYYSDNEGKTWKASKTIIDVKQSSGGAQEPGVVQLPNGKVMLWVRTNTGHPYQAYSDNDGITWSTPEPMSVPAPNSPQSIKRIPRTDDLLMIWNNSATNRFPLAAAISKDNGRTWPDIRNLDADAHDTYAYPSITFVNNWAFFTYYSGPPVGKHEKMPFWSLKFKRVPIKWLYQHEVNGKSGSQRRVQ